MGLFDGIEPDGIGIPWCCWVCVGFSRKYAVWDVFCFPGWQVCVSVLGLICIVSRVSGCILPFWVLFTVLGGMYTDSVCDFPFVG